MPNHFPIKNSPGCLGFASRSESFAIEPCGSSLLNFLATRISLRGNELLCNSCFRKLNTSANPLSCSLAFNGNSAFCFLGFTQSQNCSSLSSFAFEPKTRLVPCGSRPTLQILVKTKAGTSPTLILTIKNSPGWTRTNNLPVNSRLLRH